MLRHMHLFSAEVQKFVLAAEGLIFHDVDPQTLPGTDREAIRYYVQALSEKFLTLSVPSPLPKSESVVKRSPSSPTP
jgi:hypothetical protein